MAVSGNHVYVADRESGLRVIDISDRSSPQIVGSVDTPDLSVSVAVAGGYAYVVGDGSSGLQVIDIGNPASPQIVGSVETPGAAWGVTVGSNYVYVADGLSGLQVMPQQCDASVVSMFRP